jgi:uncharacterized protein YcbX
MIAAGGLGVKSGRARNRVGQVPTVAPADSRQPTAASRQPPADSRQPTWLDFACHGTSLDASKARMWLSEIWRYPIKSMGGEQIPSVSLGAEGIPGDRLIQVQDRRGRTVTSRSHPGLLLHRGTLGADGEPRVDDRPWQATAVARDVESAAGSGGRLAREEGLDRFDVLPLLVATDGALAALGYDRRRFRPNLILGGVPEFAERGWEGKTLAIGEALIRIATLRQRCIMVTFDPDTASQDVEVLLRIHRELGGTFALDAEVIRPGRIRVGDPAEILARAPSHRAGAARG